jgi:actin-related protein
MNPEFNRNLLLSENMLMDLALEFPIVVDNGSGFIKAGYTTTNFADHATCIPSAIGKPKYPWYSSFSSQHAQQHTLIL